MMAGVEESGVVTLEVVVVVAVMGVDAATVDDDVIVECVLPLEVVEAAIMGVVDAMPTFDDDVIVECVGPFLWDSTMKNGSTWVSGDLF